jgi:hypothetical protein
MTATFGEVSWNEIPDSNGDKKINSKDLFLRLDAGDNEVRLITQPFQYLVHKYQKSDGTGFAQKVPCSVSADCPMCLKGDEAKPRWLLGVISRKTQTFKILDIGKGVLDEIKGFNKNPKIGSPDKFDINIVVDKNGGAVGYYKVQPYSKEPLSAADQVIKDSVDFDDLKRRSSPPSAEVVQRRMDRIDGVVSVPQATGVKKTTATSTKPAPAKATSIPVVQASTVAQDDEEIEKEFPSYEGA